MPVGVSVPRVIGPLKDAWRGGPDDPHERVRGVCDGISRLRPLSRRWRYRDRREGASSCLSSPTIIVDGLAEIARFAAERGFTVGVEVLREESNGSLYTLPRTFELLDEVGAENLSVVFDIWHLWDAPVSSSRSARTRPGSLPCNFAIGGAKRDGMGIGCFPVTASRRSRHDSMRWRATVSPGSTTSRSLDRSKEGSIWEARDLRAVLTAVVGRV